MKSDDINVYVPSTAYVPVPGELLQEVRVYVQELSKYGQNPIKGLSQLSKLRDLYYDKKTRHYRREIGDVLAECGFSTCARDMLITQSVNGYFSKGLDKLINLNMWKTTRFVLDSIWNYSYESPDFAQELGKSNILELLCFNVTNFKDKEHEKASKQYFVIKASLFIMYNIARRPENKQFFKTTKAKNLVYEFQFSHDNLLKVLSLTTLAFIINASESPRLTEDTYTIETIIQWMNFAIVKDEFYRTQDGFSASELAYALGKLALDGNVPRIIEGHALKPLHRMLNSADITMQINAAKCIWTLSFNQDALKEIKNFKELWATLQRMQTEKLETDLAENINGAMWVLKEKGVAKPIPVDSSKPKHIFISYCHNEREMVKKIWRKLREAGFDVWIDIERMSGNLLEAMSSAVESASIVIMCVSEGYKQSQCCRTEAGYIYDKKKTIIPLNMQDPYSPDGWLGAMISSTLYFDFSSNADFDDSFGKLVREIERRGVELSMTPSPDTQIVPSSLFTRSSNSSSVGLYEDPPELVARMTQSDVGDWLNLETSIPNVKHMDGKKLWHLKGGEVAGVVDSTNRPVGELDKVDDISIPPGELDVNKGAVAGLVYDLSIPSGELDVNKGAVAGLVDAMSIPAGELDANKGALADVVDDINIPAGELDANKGAVADVVDAISTPAGELHVDEGAVAIGDAVRDIFKNRTPGITIANVEHLTAAPTQMTNPAIENLYLETEIELDEEPRFDVSNSDALQSVLDVLHEYQFAFLVGTSSLLKKTIGLECLRFYRDQNTKVLSLSSVDDNDIAAIKDGLPKLVFLDEVFGFTNLNENRFNKVIDVLKKVNHSTKLLFTLTPFAYNSCRNRLNKLVSEIERIENMVIDLDSDQDKEFDAKTKLEIICKVNSIVAEKSDRNILSEAEIDILATQYNPIFLECCCQFLELNRYDIDIPQWFAQPMDCLVKELMCLKEEFPRDYHVLVLIALCPEFNISINKIPQVMLDYMALSNHNFELNDIKVICSKFSNSYLKTDFQFRFGMYRNAILGLIDNKNFLLANCPLSFLSAMDAIFLYDKFYRDEHFSLDKYLVLLAGRCVVESRNDNLSQLTNLKFWNVEKFMKIYNIESQRHVHPDVELEELTDSEDKTSGNEQVYRRQGFLVGLTFLSVFAGCFYLKTRVHLPCD